ncbi:MAG TPA: formate dehydrogenase subunit delta [Geminicoccus sp.]|jgi:formate dehydrogenase subunit delta|uniref:formate dehydrogenase subunit delta n=1 Tax=Geminicoccus sp. TaxID=2024832 RepID=UPI002E2FC0F0|nr:formate dehydrogenase subunit delta [Geminicoccus sp.]HEX2529258.1 formate dehydrogenase subunit delta [Geminicoccus sp.]
MNHDRLVKMANQIATFFATQPGDQAKATAEHIRAFWDPRMRKDIKAHVEAGGEGLDPVALAAVRLIMDAETATTSH